MFIGDEFLTTIRPVYIDIYMNTITYRFGVGLSVRSETVAVSTQPSAMGDGGRESFIGDVLISLHNHGRGSGITRLKLMISDLTKDLQSQVSLNELP